MVGCWMSVPIVRKTSKNTDTLPIATIEDEPYFHYSFVSSELYFPPQKLLIFCLLPLRGKFSIATMPSLSTTGPITRSRHRAALQLSYKLRKVAYKITVLNVKCPECGQPLCIATRSSYVLSSAAGKRYPFVRVCPCGRVHSCYKKDVVETYLEIERLCAMIRAMTAKGVRFGCRPDDCH